MSSEQTLMHRQATAEPLTRERLPGLGSRSSGASGVYATSADEIDRAPLSDELAMSPEVALVTRGFLVGGACATLLMIAAGALLWRSCATRDAWTGASAWLFLSASVASFAYARTTSLRRLEAFLAGRGVPHARARHQAREWLASTLPK